jgi:hypothetical protein
MVDGLTPSHERWRALAVLLAEKVFGWERWTCSEHPETALLYAPGAAVESWWKAPELPLNEGAWVFPCMFLAPTLDTIWQAEARLTPEQSREYLAALVLMDWPDEGPLRLHLLHATVGQKAVALLRAVGVDVPEWGD